jgi:site-specific DNA recombinase
MQEHSSERAVVVYERVSTDKQDLSRQAVQRERAQADYPDRDPLVLQDDGVSAFKVSIFDRPAGQRLCELIEAGRVEAVYADAQDRLSRGDDLEWISFRALAEAHGTRIVLDGRELRTDLGGRLEGYLRALLARQESEEKSHRVSGGMRDRVARGQYVGAHRSFGYESAGDGRERRQVVNDDEAAVIIRMVEESESGRGLRPIAAGLNRDGIQTLQGRQWTPEKVRKVLRARRIGGMEPGYPPIIEAARWQRLQATLDNRRATGRRPYGGHVFIGGLLRCPHCGSGLRPRTEKTGYAFYECPKVGLRECSQGRINARAIEAEILGKLSDLVFDPDETRAKIEAAATKERERATRMIAQADKGIRTVERRRERVERDYLDEKLTAAQYQRFVATLDSDREQAEARAAELREAAAAIESEAADLDSERAAVAKLEQLQAIIGGGSREPEQVEEVRLALRDSFERIELAPHVEGGFLVTPRGYRQALDKVRSIRLEQAESRSPHGQDHGHGELHH